MQKPPDDALWQQDVRVLLAQGQKIEAIKRVRLETGAGLKDAKDFVDAMQRGEMPAIPAAAPASASPNGCALFVAILAGLAAALLSYYLMHR